jgi:hypothetical protein
MLDSKEPRSSLRMIRSIHFFNSWLETFAILGQPDTPHVGNKSQMDMFADQLVTTIGERGDHVNRQLGMNIGLLTWIFQTIKLVP